ncbi:hypothetical protein [Reichenbachiella agariperforans]|uniref:hypothetical protein n=1 Tax=Reichenbachiella agariperforans TaxID=156994 RepID=UPI001C08ECF8|nr:hypothetical protein [Reichenbachiella agariperforans]MBU2914266.1 hypothetical protein [Reichenbachiella agariperforans]
MSILYLSKAVSPRIRQMLSTNVIGTAGQSPVYQQLSTDQKLSQLPRPHFAELVKGDRLLGVCCFCERETRIDQTPLTSYYVRYFSFLDQLRVAKRLPNGRKKNSQLKQEVHELLTGTAFAHASHTPNLFYAYVDPNNARSALLCEEFGFETIGSFRTQMIGRLFPRERCLPERVTPETQPLLRKLLSTHYQNYNFYTEDNLFYQDNYFVLRDSDGKILAGLQANPEQWKIHSLPSPLGKILLNVGSRIPVFNRLLNQQFRFLAVDYIYSPDDNEQYLIQLIETLLARFGLYTAMFLVDDKSDLTKQINNINKGLISKLQKAIPISIIVKPNQLTTNQLKHLKKHPTFLSSFDTT